MFYKTINTNGLCVLAALFKVFNSTNIPIQTISFVKSFKILFVVL